MTALEQRFMDSAIAFFNRNRKDNPFIEVTSINSAGYSEEKRIVNKNNITCVVPADETNPAKTFIHFADMSSIGVTESYGEIKAKLGF